MYRWRPVPAGGPEPRYSMTSSPLSIDDPGIFMTSQIHDKPVTNFTEHGNSAWWSVRINHHQCVISSFFRFPRYFRFISYLRWFEFISQVNSCAVWIWYLKRYFSTTFVLLVSMYFATYINELFWSNTQGIFANFIVNERFFDIYR